jgi:CRP/FNR family cyclic AMP-dependent transcriptional regulator
MNNVKISNPIYKRRSRPLAGVPLNKAELARGTEVDELGLLFNGVDIQDCPEGAILFTPEDSSERLYILRKGSVDLFRVTQSGKRLVTKHILPGSVFGLMGLLGQTMHGCFAEATKTSTISVVTREDVLELLKTRFDIALRLLDMVGKRLTDIEERLVESAYSSVRVRLAHFLLTESDPESGLLLNMTHEEIGDTIGAVRQTVTEVLNSMRNQGLIVIRSKQIRVIYRRGLEEIIQNS